MKKLFSFILAAVLSVSILAPAYGAKTAKTIESYQAIDVSLEIAKGTVPGHGVDTKFGDSENLNSTVERTIWGLDVNTNYFPETAAQRKVTSTSALDAAGQSGATAIRIFYLDGDGLEQFEDIALTGQTEATTQAEILQINRVVVTAAGSGGFNAGIIYIFEGTSVAGVPSDLTKIINGITIDHNQTTSAFYTVPSNKTAFVTGVSFGVAANKTATFKVRVKSNGVFRSQFDFDLTNQFVHIPLTVPITFISGSKIRVTGILDTGSGRGSAAWGMILIDNDWL